jgi:TolB-like protein/lipopolysaccharide biosynthesis regulator YciM
MKNSGRIRGRMLAPLALVLLAAIAWLAWERMPHGPPALVEEQPATRVARPRQVYYGPPNSVAVLPFSSIAPNQEAAALAEGYASEILEALIEVSGLQVTARSSSFFFRERAGDYRIMAERLQSAHLLDGEWNNAPMGFELTLHLYDARSGREIWRRSYSPMGLTELLGLREVISGDVVAALPVPPLQGTRSMPRPDAEAWAHYVEGLRHADPSGEQDLARAADALQKALAIDAGFAAARLELAEIWLHPAWIAGVAGNEAVSGARAAVEAVLEDDPESARAWALLSYIRHGHDWDWAGAAEAGRRAAELRPGDAGILSVASLALSAVGEFESAQTFLEDSVRRDPLNLGSRLRLGLLQEFRGELEAALLSYRQILSLNPQYPGARAYRVRVKLLQGKTDAALRESDEESDPFWRRYARTLALSARPAAQEANASLQAMIEEYGSTAAFQIAEIFAFSGEVERALEWLERAQAQRDPGLSSTIGNRLLESLHADPRWPEWLLGIGLRPDDDGGGEPEH